MTEEERRLASSDLDDSPEVWQGELGNYIMETHKRQRQIDNWFGHWIIVRFFPPLPLFPLLFFIGTISLNVTFR